MARNQEFYKGSRKKRNYAIVPAILIMGLLALLVVLFYGMQKYAVITKGGVDIVLPGMSQTEAQPISEEGGTVRTFDKVETNLVFDPPDYSRVEATAGDRLYSIKAIFVEAADLNHDKLMQYEERLNDGNALLLEMKPRGGMLMWNSQTAMAKNYGLNAYAELGDSMADMIQEMKDAAKERGKTIYIAAQISCFIDELLATRSGSFALRTEYGANFTDSSGTWLDPYNADVRNYIVELVKELYALGFDEVVLADVLHPTVEKKEAAEGEEEETPSFLYSREMSTEPDPVTAICGFAVYAAEELADREGFLSIYVDSATALVRNDTNTGQNGPLFLKIYDRLYYRTDRSVYSYNLQDVQNSVSIGDPRDRLVPVVINYIPHDNNTWVLIDTESQT